MAKDTYIIRTALREDGYTPEDITTIHEEENEYGTRETHYLIYIEELAPIGEAHAKVIVKEDADGEIDVNVMYN